MFNNLSPIQNEQDSFQQSVVKAFSAYSRKFKPPVLRAVVDSLDIRANLGQVEFSSDCVKLHKC